MKRSTFLNKIMLMPTMVAGYFVNAEISQSDANKFKNGLKAIRNLDYVVLLCNDLTAMKEFYISIMKFPVYRDLGDWIELSIGSSLLTLRERGRAYDGIDNKESASVQLAFRVTPDQVDQCYEELKEAGVPILAPPAVQDWGHKTMFFNDPENNILEIYADI